MARSRRTGPWRAEVHFASRAILDFARWMTLLPSSQREQLLLRIAHPLGRLRRVNAESFDSSRTIEAAIDRLETACRAIANLRSDESRLDGLRPCPVCGSTIAEPVDSDRLIGFCPTCLGPLEALLDEITGPHGFGTDASRRRRRPGEPRGEPPCST